MKPVHGFARPCGALALLAHLGACTTLLPATAEPPAADIPPAWTAADTAQQAADHATGLQHWWRRFGDAPLEAWELRAQESNVQVRSARAALRLADAERDAAAAALSPTLGSRASAQRGLAAGQSTGNHFQAGLDAAWAPDVFGARRAALQAADATLRARAAALGEVQVQVAADVALSYLDLRASQVRLALAQESLANQRETLQITDWRLQAGLVSALELEQASAAVAQTQAVLPALQAGIVQSRHALAVLSGAPPASEAGRPDEPWPLAVPVAPDSLVLAIPADTLRQRADVRAAEHAVEAALWRHRQAQAQRWPSLALGGSVGLDALTIGALGRGTSVVGSLLASVSWPLIDGGALRAQVRIQDAVLDQARQTHHAAVLQALREVEDALVALQRDRERLVSLRVAAGAADRASLLARQRYSSGLVDFQTVLETQRTQFSAQDAVVSTSADLGRDHVNLIKALGGGWREAPAPAQPATTP